MTLARSIVPVLLYDGKTLVKGRSFASDRTVGNAVQQARVYTSIRDVDELVLLDVRATIERREPPIDLIKAVSETCFVPLSFGGGIDSVEKAALCIEAGAEKVILGSAPMLNTGEPMAHLVHKIADRWGSNAVTVSVDFKKDGENRARVCVRSGTLLTSFTIEEWGQLVVKRGAGELLLQSIERDGTLEGYDLDAIKAMRDAVPTTRLIVSGGCGTYEHMAQALDAGADAVAAGAMWVFTDQTPAGARNYLMDKGYDVRPPMRPLEKVK